MTELEFALNSFLLESSGASNRQRMKIDAVGDDYKALRALRCVSHICQLRHLSLTPPRPPTDRFSSLITHPWHSRIEQPVSRH